LVPNGDRQGGYLIVATVLSLVLFALVAHWLGAF